MRFLVQSIVLMLLLTQKSVASIRYKELTRASEFAGVGIKSAGMAIGPKKALKEILKRTE
jgi:hypothetical protein